MNMKDYLMKKISPRKGKIYSYNGGFVGYHPGTMYFTIGQRIGPRLGIEIFPMFKEISGKRWYVAEKRKGNVLIIAPEGNPILKRKKIVINKIHLINPNEKIPSKGLKARIRHLGGLMHGRLIEKKGKNIFVLDEPADAIAEGQAIVLYKGRELIGGGEIRLK
jgi:tRNA-specific 2-thiouridylase